MVLYTAVDADGAPMASLRLDGALAGKQPTAVVLSLVAGLLPVGTEDGTLYFWNLEDPEAPVLEDHLNASFAGISALQMLVADQSLVVGTASGEIAIYFRVRYATVRNDGSVTHAIDGVDLTPGATQVFLDRDLGRRLAHLPDLHTETVGAPWTRIRSFATHTAAVTHIATSPRVKGFASVDANGTLALHHSTSERQLLRLESAVHGTRSLVFTPRGDGVVALAADGRGHIWVAQ